MSRLTRQLGSLVLVASAACAKAPPPASPPPPAPRLDATETEGASPEKVRAIFQPAAEALHRCSRGQTGKLTMRVTNRAGTLQVDAQPGASLDPTLRACAQDALSAVWLEETGSNVGGPAVPPPGFVSLITVTW